MRILLSRLTWFIPTLLLVLLTANLLVALSPTDPAALYAGETASAEQVAQIRERLGLDQPFVERYVEYVAGAAQGDLGASFRTGQSVTSTIAKAVPVTLSLAGLSMLFAVVLSVPIGLAAALRPRGVVDRLVSFLSSVCLAVPPFVLAVPLVIAFAVHRAWFPAIGYVAVSENPTEWLRHMVLPAAALALSIAAELTRQIRAAMVGALEQDYIFAQHAKGMPRRLIVAKHAGKNAGLAIVTIVGLQFGRVIGGAVVIETVFVLPGFGKLAVDSVLGRDLPMTQGIVVIGACLVLIVNLLVDLSYAYFNPRLRDA